MWYEISYFLNQVLPKLTMTIFSNKPISVGIDPVKELFAVLNCIEIGEIIRFRMKDFKSLTWGFHIDRCCSLPKFIFIKLLRLNSCIGRVLSSPLLDTPKAVKFSILPISEGTGPVKSISTLLNTAKINKCLIATYRNYSFFGLRSWYSSPANMNSNSSRFPSSVGMVPVTLFGPFLVLGSINGHSWWVKYFFQ